MNASNEKPQTASPSLELAEELPKLVGLLTPAQVAAHLTISRRTLERLVAAGDFPAPLKIGRSSRFQPGDINAFLEKLRRERGDRVGAS